MCIQRYAAAVAAKTNTAYTDQTQSGHVPASPRSVLIAAADVYNKSDGSPVVSPRKAQPRTDAMECTENDTIERNVRNRIGKETPM